MNYLPSQNISGPVFALAGLALAAPSTFLARHYSRSLYLAQMLYIFSFVYNTTTSSSFSQNLNYSWLSFMPSFTSNYCTSGDFSCNYGNLISPALCWLGGAVLALIIIKLISWKKKDVKFLSFYNLYKGLFYWFFAPLIYYSTLQIIYSIQHNSLNKDFIAAIIVVVVFAAVSVIEITGYKIAQRQEENVWRKWIQFFSHYMLASIMVCVVLSTQVSSLVKYLINIPLCIFSILYLIYYKFNLRILERIFMFIQDAIIISIYNIFVINYNNITTYDLDFYALGIVIIIEILELFVKFITWCKDAGEDDRMVSPERESRDKKNVNAFLQDEQINPQNSNDNIGSPSNSPRNSNNPNSPRRGGNNNRRR